MNMRLLGNLKYEVAFNSICYAIKEKTIDSKDIFESHVGVCEKFFDNILTGLESLLKERYFLVENIKEVVNVFGYDKISKENLHKIISDIKKTIKDLNRLKENPAAFYNSNKSEKLYDVSRKIKELYLNKVNFFEFA